MRYVKLTVLYKSMNRVLVSLHNGAGDLVITFPFVAHLLSKGYTVSYETVPGNFDLIRYFFKDVIQTIPYTESPNPINRFVKNKSDDIMFNVNREYDYVVNLNNMYYLNEISHKLYKNEHAKQLNRQVLVAFLFANSYLMDLPKSLVMSEYFRVPKNPTNQILFFTYSKAAENRRLNKKTIKELQCYYESDKNVLINPRYNTLYDLCDAINNAKLVITVDTAPLHISEILSTPWIGLFTNNSDSVLSQYYIHKKQIIMSNVMCSPCNYHGGGCNRNKNGEFDCIGGFDPKFIIETIHIHTKDL